MLKRKKFFQLTTSIFFLLIAFNRKLQYSSLYNYLFFFSHINSQFIVFFLGISECTTQQSAFFFYILLSTFILTFTIRRENELQNEWTRRRLAMASWPKRTVHHYRQKNSTRCYCWRANLWRPQWFYSMCYCLIWRASVRSSWARANADQTLINRIWLDFMRLLARSKWWKWSNHKGARFWSRWKWIISPIGTWCHGFQADFESLTMDPCKTEASSQVIQQQEARFMWSQMLLETLLNI